MGSTLVELLDVVVTIKASFICIIYTKPSSRRVAHHRFVVRKSNVIIFYAVINILHDSVEMRLRTDVPIT